MFINEIRPGVEVVLSCFAGNKWVKFKLTTDQLQGPKAIKAVGDAVNGKFLMTEPARSQGKILNFPPQYRYDLSYAFEGKFYSWSGVRVYSLQIDKPKKRVLIITSNEQGKRSDRRKSYRLKIDVKGEVKFGNDGQTESVVVKDVSSTGVGILVSEKNTKANAGDVMTVSFTENKNNQSFTFRAKIVRIESMSGGKSIYGGVIIGDRSKQEITRFIEKERKMVTQK